MAVFPPVPSPPVLLGDAGSASPASPVPVDAGDSIAVASPPVDGVEIKVTTTMDGTTTSPETVALGVTILVMIWVEGARDGAVTTKVGTLAEDDGAGGRDDDGAGVEEGAGGVEDGRSMGVELGSSDAGGGAAEVLFDAIATVNKRKR